MSSPPVFFGGVLVAHLFSFLCCPIMCRYVLSSMMWCPLRFPHKNDVRFVFTSSCLQESSCLIYVVCLRIVVSYTYCVVFLFVCFFVLCILFLRFLRIIHFLLPFLYSLTFITDLQKYRFKICTRMIKRLFIRVQ